ncbi:hypothetical protein FHX42_003201 [Saccharopolyspora lacisalsi]|uniref:VanZ family protein n=1 Tax=Halosaccharopolyspora lacisalsi TaxID=1000566 RepID=A0A839E278_9PSEU|nr:VanZ family protein [Halosaccharopolyspora lacisalsi]MBA8825835.1 hypothetical protein [Halosaccharopolyspora lacisalsi]
MLDPYRAHWARAPFIIVLAISLVILFTPASGVPTAPPGTDKVVHLLLFALLAVTGGVGRLPLGGLSVGLLCYAATSEALQAILPLNRSGDVLDATVDALGAAAGLLVVFLLPSRRRIRR